VLEIKILGKIDTYFLSVVSTRVSAITALEMSDNIDSQVIDVLVDSLDDSESSVKSSAALTIGKLGLGEDRVITGPKFQYCS